MTARATRHPGFCDVNCARCDQDEAMAHIRDMCACDDPVFASEGVAWGRWVACGTCARCEANPDLDPED